MKNYKITVKGTAQLNGPLIINKSFFVNDERIAQSFTGSKRYEVIQSWILTNYPGAKILNIKNFGATIELINEKEVNSKSSWWKL